MKNVTIRHCRNANSCDNLQQHILEYTEDETTKPFLRTASSGTSSRSRGNQKKTAFSISTKKPIGNNVPVTGITSLSKPKSSLLTQTTALSYNIPSVEMQFQHLKPSQEVLNFYQEKIKRLRKENEEMQARIDDCMSLCDKSIHLEQELTEKNSEIGKLKKALSDLEVYVYQERKQTLLLYAENDKLKIRELYDRSKINFLLDICGTHKSEIGVVLHSNKEACYVPQKWPVKLQHYKNICNSFFGHEYNLHKLKISTSPLDDDELQTKAVNLEALALAAQLQEQTCLNRGQVQTLLKDREVTQKEHEFECQRLESRISSLIAKLKLTQDKLCSTTKDLLTLHEIQVSKETIWMKEKEQMKHHLDISRKYIGESFPSLIGYNVSGQGIVSKSLLESKIKDLSSLREKLQEKDSVVVLYKNQIVLLEEELNKLRRQTESSKCLFKKQSQQLSAQVKYLKKKYNELDRRRLLEAEGFRNDIKILKNGVHDLEKKIYKVNHGLTPSQLTQITKKDAVHILETSHDTVYTAQQLKKDMLFIKNKVLEIESELRPI